MWKWLGVMIVGIAVGAAGFGWGFLTHRHQSFPYDWGISVRRWWSGAEPGRWERARPPSDRLDGLLALPYLQGYELATGHEGVTRHDPERSFQGVNLYTSGHTPGALLVDMQGNPLHEWNLPVEAVWDDVPLSSDTEFWRRARLVENGSLLAIFEDTGLIKVDVDSNLVWSYRGGCHHDVFPGTDGQIYVLGRRVGIVPRWNPYERLVDDQIVILDSRGREQRVVSVLEAFERSDYAPLLGRAARAGDIFHTNTIEILDGRHADRLPAFRKGNALVSFRELDTVAVIDLEEARVVWALAGLWRRQHEPTLLDNGNLLVFDNRGLGRRSRVLELDPATQEIMWRYGLDGEFYTREIGSNQRLPNGNTLITESEKGRAFEVTIDGDVVWEFRSPHRAGEEGELVATLFDMERIPRKRAAFRQFKANSERPDVSASE